MNYFSQESPPCFDWLDKNNIYSIRYTKFILAIKNKRPETKRKKNMHLHHIKPRHYFRDNNQKIDNSETNLISLTPREHALAHYILYKATKNYKDRWALCRTLRDNKLKKSTRFLDNYKKNPVVSEETKKKHKKGWEKRRKENRAEPWNKGLKGDPKSSEAAKKAWETRRANGNDKMKKEQKNKISESVSKTKKGNPKSSEAAKKAWKTRKENQSKMI